MPKKKKMTKESKLHLHMHPLSLSLLLLVVTQASAMVPAVIVFGDSTVDSGNNNQIPTLLKSDFEPYGRDFFGGKATGRFCNGRLAPDFISEKFGLKPVVPAYLDPAYGIDDFATGVCFASAGTGFDNATSDVLSVIPLWKEVEYFKEYAQRLAKHQGKARASRTIREALYIISIGTNDWLENYYILPTRSSQYTVEQYEDFLVELAAEFLAEIYRVGARKVSFTGLSPIGCVPLERTAEAVVRGAEGCSEEYNASARRFNGKLGAMLERMRESLPGYRLVFTEMYDIVFDIIQHPSSYGFEDVERGCCSTGLFEMGYLCAKWNPFTCEDADKFVWWDAFHPTEKMNRILANHNIQNGLAQFL